MDRRKFVALVACLSPGCKRKRVITVGSKDFTEQYLLGEIAAQHVENRLHVKVGRRLNLAGTQLIHQALLNRDIDLYPEYTGIGLMEILKDPVNTDAGVTLARVRQEYARVMQLEWLDPLGIDNARAIAVRNEDARQLRLETIGDAANVKSYWTLGAGYEFLTRADGYSSLMTGYNFEWAAAPRSMDLGVLYKAIDEKQVNMIAGGATDGLLSNGGLKVLKDDKQIFPSYQACIVARTDSCREFPELRPALTELSAKFTNEKMRKLNYQVDGEHRPVEQVAAEFLRDAGLR
jgi:glycine betaine/choline ABC-type transport system substrate-binding protein